MISSDDERSESERSSQSQQGPPALTQSELIARSMENASSSNRQSMANASAPIRSERVSSEASMISPQMGDMGYGVQVPGEAGPNNSRAGPASERKEGVDEANARMRHWVIIFGLFILICVGAGAIVVPLYVKPQYKTVKHTHTHTPTISPEVAPIMAPTQFTTANAPFTLAPTYTLAYVTFVEEFAKKKSDPAVFEDPTSPQYKAADFIANVVEYKSIITDDAMLGDLYALSVFYFSTGGDSWYECSQGSDNCPDGVSWMSSTVPYCDWKWIACNEGSRIVDIIFSDVDGNNLIGTLQSELGLITELEQFVAVNDDIQGILPEKFGDLTHVTHFILSNNSLTGEIPDAFLANSPVEVFMVPDNQFEGTIPTSLWYMTSAFQIILDHNRFSGSIPDAFGSLPNLATLALNSNRFSGEIPESIFSPSMENLYVGDSDLVGIFPSSVGKARNLVRLHVTNSEIFGALPEDLFTLPSLSELHLYNNQLTGGLPASLANLGETLRDLILDGNFLSGDLPIEAINRLLVSNHLSFGRNDFSGEISAETCGRKGEGYDDLQLLTVDCEEVICSCCDNCPV